MDEPRRVKLLSVTLSFLKMWSRNLVDTWLGVLIKSLAKPLPESLEKDVLQLINFLSENSQNFLNKYISARMIGALAEVW